MLDELHVSNVALIAEATFVPGPGLTVVTGETGAGKTALLGSLKLLVGDRADASLVTEGASGAVVEGRFFLQGDDSEDGHVVCRRLSADGKSRISIDGSMSTVSQLAQSIGCSVDLCGQHEHQTLYKAAHHGKLFDAWAGTSVALLHEEYECCWNRYSSARSKLESLIALTRSSAEELERAQFICSRIGELRPSPDEYQELVSSLPRLEHAEELAMQSGYAYQVLSEDGGALDSLRASISALEGIAGLDDCLGEYVQLLIDASCTVEDVMRDVRSYRDSVDNDPEALMSAQSRLSDYQGLMRTYGPGIEEVMGVWKSAQATIDSVENSDSLIAEAEKLVEQEKAALMTAGKKLHEQRMALVGRFESLVSDEFSRLEMGSASLLCSIALLPFEKWSKSDCCSIEFLYRPASSLSPRPLVKIASGGEMSRVMLSLKVVLGSADSRETLVFDEVDAGIGGSVANSLAAVLKGLAQTHQVIVVTHLPQVAARGQVHYVVEKSEVDGVARTSLRRVEGDDRVKEIARMLSGDHSDAALAHAAQLLG